MSGFIRPQVRAKLWRWREVIGGGVVVLLGVWLGQRPGPVNQLVGATLTFVAIAFIFLAWRRVRFTGRDDAPGVVSVDEGEIAYYGPQIGGAIARDSLTEVRLRNTSGRLSWFLITETGEALSIPHDAHGAELLFDAFAALPGLSSETLLRAITDLEPGTQTVWQRAGRSGLTRLR